MGGAAGAAVAVVIVVALVSGLAFRNPTIGIIESKGGTVFQATEDEIASVVAGEARRLAADLGRRHVHDR